MDRSLQTLCDALKKIATQIKPHIAPVSFVLVTGKINQGKTGVLRQSHLKHYAVELENSANFFYNDHGIILELGETWLNQSDMLLANTLKHLNRCHTHIKITGLILCIDSSDLLLTEPLQQMEQSKSHTQLLERFGQSLGYRVHAALMFTKLDALVGFCEFFQSEHVNDLKKPLGFSLEFSPERNKLIGSYRLQFDHMIEKLGQQIIGKLHPARSGAKRTLIREFPLQLASLRTSIQTLIQSIPTTYFRLQAIYFTSAEQGGLSIDRLNKKIQHEYALTVQDKFPQSNNYRAYFIEGALQSFLQQTPLQINPINKKQKLTIGIIAGVAGLLLTCLGYQHLTTAKLLDEASKELLTYETLISQEKDKTTALYHLSLAEAKLGLIPTGPLTSPLIKQLKAQLHANTQNKLQFNFLPDLVRAVESVIVNPGKNQLERYQALKVYLMLGEPQYYSEAEVLHWFSNYWKTNNPNNLNDKPLLLLKNTLKQSLQPLAINRQLVIDTRNYLNALPAAYLYYSLAKGSFPQEKINVSIDGFDLASRELPVYFTKEGFKQITAIIPEVTAKLQQENWVLARQDLDNLQAQLEEAYCFDYVTWWQNFTKRTRPQHYQGYEQARQLTLTMHQTKAIPRLINFIQQETSPDLSPNSALFNQKIANQFTHISLMSSSATHELTQNINELEKFLTTLSLVKDDGKTVFDLTRARFEGESSTDPLSALYNRARQLPEPISTWAKQIADDTWYIFINESRNYLNNKWQNDVFRSYQSAIAHRYPLDSSENDEVALEDFNRFFSPQGTLNSFVNYYLKPFIDTSHPQWQPKELNGYVLPISADLINELIRANVISNMFFPDNSPTSKIEFSLQKINLDPVVASLHLAIGQTVLTDNQESDSYTLFNWPQADAKLTLKSIEGNHFELEERGTWAFFKMLQKVNVLVDSNDSASLQILFEVNGNSGRYLLKTQNQINPFSPGILTGFNLNKDVA
ncbi:MAG: type IVB secretion system protein IcmF [Legionella sp.]|nr:type IVB secretion system protein IcmF [Legionella sp.]